MPGQKWRTRGWSGHPASLWGREKPLQLRVLVGCASSGCLVLVCLLTHVQMRCYGYYVQACVCTYTVYVYKYTYIGFCLARPQVCVLIILTSVFLYVLEIVVLISNR